jgi:hypothetical protein
LLIKNGDPVLFFAVKGGKEDCVAHLLDNHADINAIGAVSCNQSIVYSHFIRIYDN